MFLIFSHRAHFDRLLVSGIWLCGEHIALLVEGWYCRDFGVQGGYIHRGKWKTVYFDRHVKIKRWSDGICLKNNPLRLCILCNRALYWIFSHTHRLIYLSKLLLFPSRSVIPICLVLPPKTTTQQATDIYVSTPSISFFGGGRGCFSRCLLEYIV